MSAGAMGVSSSRPLLCTTRTFLSPSFINAPAMSSEMSVEYTPTSPNWAPAGFRRGPSKLKAVRTFNAPRTERMAFMAGWYLGAYMKPTRASLRHASTPFGPKSIDTFNASSTSALPHIDDTDRLPVLAMCAPAAAATMLAPVLILTEPMPSPPVPTMSTTGTEVSTVRALPNIARAIPAISSGVSPLALRRTKRAAACSAEKSSKRVFNIASDCCSDKSLRSIKCSRTSRICIPAALHAIVLLCCVPRCFWGTVILKAGVPLGAGVLTHLVRGLDAASWPVRLASIVLNL
mmetsp:Transcript_4373/g.10158  ORF Transcript_4373/g.10158 Transcript_4373/m.10158 type:complete len:291 (-) Transcript_4373:7-879(-)